MNKNIIITQAIKEKLDLRILIKIIQILNIKNNEKNIDYLQIFQINKNVIINIQEEPKKQMTYNLDFQIKFPMEIWAVQNFNKNFETYWTILFPEEY